MSSKEWPRPIGKAIVRLILGSLPLFISSIATSDTIVVNTKKLELFRDQPQKRDLGKLRYRGGLVISSSNPNFGGFSALGVSANGNRMIALSDRGRRLAAQLIYSETGNLTGLKRTQLDTLAGLDGLALQEKHESDIECMSPGVEGEIIVGFERHHRLWRYFPGRILPTSLSHPEELSQFPENSGIEGLSLLIDGRLFAIAEGLESLPSTLAWVSHSKGWSTMTYALDNAFRPTGAATLFNGDVLVLERKFTLRGGIAARIRRINGSHIKPAADLTSTMVAEFRDPVVTENFEGIAVRREPNRKTMIYIVSDDNFNPMQRTLLMMFEIKD